MPKQTVNHLVNETSPYLLQHAHHPVAWYPWSSEALEKARKENKPILLSIGYAACHWCHVMAHESFEDVETAALMNQLFINIKVDREERPDLDKIYQTAHYFLTRQSGGWPLTVFLTPEDLTPFFSGTYFPPQPRQRLPAFKTVLQDIAAAYVERKTDIKQQNISLTNMLRQTAPIISDVHMNEQPIQLALRTLQRNFDPQHGGFGFAPKFPQQPKLEFLLRFEPEIALQTLLQMASGGIYDQLQGGFFRYSVDAAWQIPHFEKMLYDNAQLLNLYSRAGKYHANARLLQVARTTADWVVAAMQSQQGGYYSSLDADSEGEEGRYYIWKKNAVAELLTPNEFTFANLYFGFDEAPNFEDSWHLREARAFESVAQTLNLTLPSAQTVLNSIQKKLLQARAQRVTPTFDTKVLTAWNALMIKALLATGNILQENKYSVSAQAALACIENNLWANKRLLATCKDGKAHLAAYLDDYVFLLDALLTSLQFAWETKYLFFACELAETIIEHFSDPTTGGFFFTPNDHEELLYRPKTMMDEAIPAGNAVAVQAFTTLGYLLGETRYLQIAEKILQAAWPILTQHPAEHCTLLVGLQDYLHPPQIIILRGPKENLSHWQEHYRNLHNHVFAIPDSINDLPGALAAKVARAHTCVYICEGTHCKEAVILPDLPH